MMPHVVHQLIHPDDVILRDDVPVIGLAVNGRDHIRRELEDFESDVGAVQRQARSGLKRARQ